jgi:hypothetical protein
VAPIRRFLSALVALVFVAAATAGDARAQESVRLAEQDIKAGLLYNFLRYTEWPQPSASGATMVVCIYGRDPFSGRLASMSGRTVNQRTIEVRVLQEAAQANACSLLFLSADERSNWPRLRSQLGERGVLTVSDYDGFARSGGMIEFTRINNRIGVRVNVEAAQAANLSVQDRLLRLASVVRTAP